VEGSYPEAGIVSIWQAPNGRYYVSIDLPTANGRRRRRGIGGFKTKKAAKAAEAEALRKLHEGTYVEPSRLTMGAYLLDHWLPGIGSQVRPTTLAGYRFNVTRYIVPRIGAVPLQKLSVAAVKRLYAELEAGGGRDGRPLAAKSVIYVHVTLRRALRDAVSEGLLVRNVAALARPPRARRVEMRTWDAGQLDRFLASIRTDRLYAPLALLATTGMRRGELLGLRWVNVDLDAGRVAIRRTMVMVAGKPQESEPKTAKGRRPVPVAAEVIQALREWKAYQAAERLEWGPGYTDSGGLVVTTEDGRPLHPETLSAAFVRHAKAAGLPPIRLHDLRHTAASILLAQGVHPKVVSEMLGHATVGLTRDTYSHVIPSLADKAADVIAGAVFRAPTPPQRPASPQVRPIASGS
jgi:integrase